MNSQSQLTVDVIAKVAEGKISILNASKLLNKSSRAIERYLSRYKKMAFVFINTRSRTAQGQFQISKKQDKVI